MTSKICTKCGEEKALTEFNKRSRSDDGLNYQCRECSRSYNKTLPKGYNSEYKKQWAKDNPDKVNAATKRWRENHPEKSKECSQNWRAANPERARETKRLWSKENKDKVNFHTLTRRSRQGENTPKLTEKQERQVKEMIVARNALNEYGAGIHVWHIDHVIPVAAGGGCNPENLQILTAEENLRKGAKVA